MGLELNVVRRTSIRALNLVVAGVFLASLGESAFGLHACPHHDGIAGHAASDAEPAPAQHHAVNPESGESHDGPCSCVGQCNVSSGLAVFDAGRPASGAVSATIVRSAVAPLLSPRRAPTPYLIPFANAPPA
jgi:hypothetical protein